MRLVRQRGSLDCGIAVVAMLANCSYRTVESLIRTTALYPHKKRGMRAREMVMLLNELHPSWWKVSRKWRGARLDLNWQEMVATDDPYRVAPVAVLIVRDNAQHWVVLDPVYAWCYVLDPSQGLVAIEDSAATVIAVVSPRH